MGCYNNYLPAVGWYGSILMVLFWALIIWGLVYLARRMGADARLNMPGGESRAMEVLKERYAKGEISKQEFEAKKKDLSA